MQFCILGPVEIFDKECRNRIVPPGKNQRALLATLVIKAGQVMSTDRLINELWGVNPPTTAVNSLQATVARLRRLMDTSQPEADDWAILTQESGYLMRPGRERTDADRFVELSDQGRAMVAVDPGRAVPLLRQALDVWRGPALEDAVCGDICATFAIQFTERRLAVLETLYYANLRLGRHHDIVAELEGLVGEHPFRERFHDLLMVALYRSGRQAEALSVYERLRTRLARELGLEPSPALQRRVLDVLNREVELDGAGPPRRGAAFWPDQEADVTNSIISGLFHEVGHLRHRLEVLTREHNALFDRLDGMLPALGGSKGGGK
ncbi:AfsR/SARP family transcriptional regulator [Streptosporangium sp. NPDC023615]|uniref:AfsR/SARP family transcriptional regulator n=1 Tax=Streptosporangium sp. NPDC023615 TaxID=3154794 RepID=UPI003413C085